MKPRTARAVALLDELGAHLRAHPEIAERTADYLNGSLEEGPMAEPMRNLTIRLPVKLIEAAERLAPALEAEPMAATWGGRVVPAAVLRLALARGLAILEAEYGRPKGKGGRR